MAAVATARIRIAALEHELVLTRDACELFDEQAVVPPKRGRAVVEGLIARGHSARSACRISRIGSFTLQYHRRRPSPDCEVRPHAATRIVLDDRRSHPDPAGVP